MPQRMAKRTRRRLRTRANFLRIRANLGDGTAVGTGVVLTQCFSSHRLRQRLRQQHDSACAGASVLPRAQGTSHKPIGSRGKCGQGGRCFLRDDSVENGQPSQAIIAAAKDRAAISLLCHPTERTPYSSAASFAAADVSDHSPTTRSRSSRFCRICSSEKPSAKKRSAMSPGRPRIRPSLRTAATSLA